MIPYSVRRGFEKLARLSEHIASVFGWTFSTHDNNGVIKFLGQIVLPNVFHLTGLQSRLFSEDDIDKKDLFSAIDSEEFSFGARLPPRMFLQIPREIIGQIRNMSIRSGMFERGRARLGSFFYDNVEQLFPGSLPGRNEYVT